MGKKYSARGKVPGTAQPQFRKAELILVWSPTWLGKAELEILNQPPNSPIPISWLPHSAWSRTSGIRPCCPAQTHSRSPYYSPLLQPIYPRFSLDCICSLHISKPPQGYHQRTGCEGKMLLRIRLRTSSPSINLEACLSH